MITIFKQGLPQDDFESPPLEELKMISKMCRELRPGNISILYNGADVHSEVQSGFGESATKSFEGMQETRCFEEHLVDVGCPPQV